MEETEEVKRGRNFINKVKNIGIIVGAVAIGYAVGKQKTHDKCSRGLNNAIMNDYLQLTKPGENGPVPIQLNEWNVEMRNFKNGNK